jgi:hypothetical protein
MGRGGRSSLGGDPHSSLQVADGISVFPLGQRQLRGIDEPERVLRSRSTGSSTLGAPAEEETAAAPQARPLSRLEQQIARRFGPRRPPLGRDSRRCCDRSREGRPGEPSAVDDMAARFESLGDEIDARVRAALAKKGITDQGPGDG